jgi:hypothetical protein
MEEQRFFASFCAYWSSVRSMGVPMDGYSNLFIAVGIAVSLFLVVHHVGHSVIRYLNRYKNCIVKKKARKEILDETRNGRLRLKTSSR